MRNVPRLFLNIKRAKEFQNRNQSQFRRSRRLSVLRDQVAAAASPDCETRNEKSSTRYAMLRRCALQCRSKSKVRNKKNIQVQGRRFSRNCSWLFQFEETFRIKNLRLSFLHDKFTIAFKGVLYQTNVYFGLIKWLSSDLVCAVKCVCVVVGAIYAH